MREWMRVGLVALVMAGCAEAGDGSGGAGATSGSGAASSTASSSTSSAGAAGGGGTSSGSSTSGGGGLVGHPVINEISAKGADWVEIGNPSGHGLELGGFGLCDDVDPTAGSACDESTMVRFPAGTMLPAGGSVIVIGDQAAADGGGPHVKCLDGAGPTTCFYATWKVSASNGETVHLVDPDGDVVDEATYPPDAVPAGQTWGRLPDGTGPFAPTLPTPGAPNVGP